MARDDFSKETLDRLAKRVGVRCSNPSCRKLTTGPRTDSPFIINIGVGAHITAASPGGPRYDSSLSPQQRKSDENGIWLCQNHAKLVDDDQVAYSAEALRAWKAEAEASARAELEGGAQPKLTDFSGEIDIIRKNKQITPERHDYCLEVTLTNRGTEPIGFSNVDLEMPACVVSSPEAHPLYVRERSTPNVAFFRLKSSNHEQQIYPGDPKLVLSIPYYVDRDLYYQNRESVSFHQNRVNFFHQPVKATLYRPGFQPVRAGGPFKDFQDF